MNLIINDSYMAFLPYILRFNISIEILIRAFKDVHVMENRELRVLETAKAFFGNLAVKEMSSGIHHHSFTGTDDNLPPLCINASPHYLSALNSSLQRCRQLVLVTVYGLDILPCVLEVYL